MMHLDLSYIFIKMFKLQQKFKKNVDEKIALFYDLRF